LFPIGQPFPFAGYRNIGNFICNLNSACSVQVSVNDLISDNALIDRIKSGDMASFELMVDRHKNFAYTLALRVIQNEADAEEVAHDAFIKVLNSINSFQKKSKFTTWFYRIVLNMAISRQRKKKIKTEDIHANRSGMMHQVSIEAYGAMAKQDRTYYLDKALNTLAEEERMLITLYYYKELSLGEMEEITGIEKNNMKVKIFRARKKLATVLSQLLPDEVESIL